MRRLFLAAALLLAALPARADGLKAPPLSPASVNGALAGGLVQTNTGTMTGGTVYLGDAWTGGKALFLNSFQGSLAVNGTTYPGGAYPYGCFLTASSATAEPGCFYGAMAVPAGQLGGAMQGFGYATGDGANAFGAIFIGQSVAGQTSGAAHGAYVGITSLSTNTGFPQNGLEVSAFGASVAPASNGISLYNNNNNGAIPAYIKAVVLNVSTGHQLATYAYLTDSNYPAAEFSTPPVSTPYGMYWINTNFTTAEYQSSNLLIGPTVLSPNSRIVVNGSAAGAPSLGVAGQGASPATNASFGISALGTGAVLIGSGLRLKAMTVAALPACNSGTEDQLYAVSDATAPSYGAALTGGGAVRTLAYCNASAWTAH